ncbi:sugar transporter SWEET1 isoform X3 [Prorops nasuta]|uniref:sugar transporter SWEET1 isoform X3 n=1 Tax=Prorops nasuta TaxID=863751 RepID=UPI0034CD1F51
MQVCQTITKTWLGHVREFRPWFICCPELFCLFYRLLCKNIYQRKTSEGTDPMPFVGGIGMGILMLRYAWILQDQAMISVNVFGMLVNILYLTIYYIYSPKEHKTNALVGKMASVVAAILAYVEIENPDNIEYRYGMIVTAIFFLLIASPLIHLSEIIKTKNTDILPFPLIFMGTFVSSQWLLYGFIIQNNFIIFQNAVGLMLLLGQLSLFVIFPSNKADKFVKDSKHE